MNPETLGILNLKWEYLKQTYSQRAQVLPEIVATI